MDKNYIDPPWGQSDPKQSGLAIGWNLRHYHFDYEAGRPAITLNYAGVAPLRFSRSAEGRLVTEVIHVDLPKSADQNPNKYPEMTFDAVVALYAASRQTGKTLKACFLKTLDRKKVSEEDIGRLANGFNCYARPTTIEAARKRNEEENLAALLEEADEVPRRGPGRPRKEVVEEAASA